jgi:hypothetical protein
MAWEVEDTDEFALWWASLTDDEQADVSASVELLELHGPQLGRPHVDTIKGSRHSKHERKDSSNGRTSQVSSPAG